MSRVEGKHHLWTKAAVFSFFSVCVCVRTCVNNQWKTTVKLKMSLMPYLLLPHRRLTRTVCLPSALQVNDKLNSLKANLCVFNLALLIFLTFFPPFQHLSP